MLDKDKLMFVVYFGVKSMPNNFKVNQMLIGWSENLKRSFDDSVKTFVVPQRTTDEIKMEILNPELVSEEKIEQLIKIYNEFLEKHKINNNENSSTEN